jgi:flagellar export protein FliJ
MFRFRLEKVRRYRARLVDERAAALKAAEERRRVLEDEARRLDAIIDHLVAEGEAERLTIQDVQLWRRRTAYLSHLRERREELAARIKEADRRVAEKRRELLDAHRTLKVLDKLREAQHRQWLVAQMRRERKELDEIGGIRAHLDAQK